MGVREASQRYEDFADTAYQLHLMHQPSEGPKLSSQVEWPLASDSLGLEKPGAK